ncbi:MAG: adenylate kinase [Mariprofundales bacterium]
MRMVLFGQPGVGKGTQSSALVKELAIPQYATGDMLRAAVRIGSVLGMEAKQYMEAGELVPDSVVIGLIEERITTAEASNGFILDGFPRNATQAKALDVMLKKHVMQLDRVIFMLADKSVIIERLSGRLLCRACGFGFHRHYSPPREDGCCDKCGGEVYQRADDKELVIAQRLRVYDEQTSPLLDYYANHHGFRSIDANGDMQVVYKRLKQVLES